MTDLLIHLRRSPRTLLERDGQSGPGPGRLALVMARAGVGKTAFLVGIGLDAMFSGENVLHMTVERTVEKVRSWYDDLLDKHLTRELQIDHGDRIRLQIERRRHIHTYMGSSFSVKRVRDTLEMLVNEMEYRPGVLIVDRLELESIPHEQLQELKQLATEFEAELWMSCRTHRDGPEPKPGHLPPPAEGFEDIVDLAFALLPEEREIGLHVLKDRDEILNQALPIKLDPTTLMLVPDRSSRAG
jgi:hypothetical protein